MSGSGPPPATPAVSVEPLRPAQREQVLALVGRAAAADGVDPLSEQALLRLTHGTHAAGRSLVGLLGDAVAGYAHVDDAAGPGVTAEVVVDPPHRRRGLGRALVDAVTAGAGAAPVQLWAHGRLPDAARLAAATGMVEDRTLLRMARPLGPGSAELPEPVWPEGIAIEPFRVGRDEQSWLAVNARAFSRLPDQGGWTLDDLSVREGEPWFDPAGFFLAWRGEELLGFHWTKVHDRGPDGRGPVGEVYVVGVDPAAQGLGLGRSLTLLGLHHLQDKGLGEVMLYVDGDNAAAVGLYTSLGFATRDLDIRFTRPR